MQQDQGSVAGLGLKVRLAVLERAALPGNFLGLKLQPEFVQDTNAPGDKNQKMWGLMGQYLGRDMASIQKSIVAHVEYTLAMTRFNFSNFVRFFILSVKGCAQAVAYSLRDRMIECFNDTN